jgi:short-subunit dehydrogenase
LPFIFGENQTLPSLNSKCILLAGCSTGVGLACLEQLHDKGYQVVGLTHNQNFIGSHPQYPLVYCDFAQRESLLHALAQLQKEHFKPDIIICNAGTGEIQSIENSSEEHLRNMMEVNFFAHHAIIRTFLPEMCKQQQGMIIGLGSVVTQACFPLKAQYNSSKWALEALFQTLWQEVYPLGVRVHLLVPGWIRSEFHRSIPLSPTIPLRYQAFYHKAADYTRDHHKIYPDGFAIAQKIVRLIEGKKNPLIIPIGPDAKALFVLKALTPRRFIFWLIATLSKTRNPK